jgi:histidinol-phosphate aminotransferase
MKVRAAIRNMTPYSPPLEGRDPSVNTLLDFNESVLPPGSDILAAMHRFIDSGRLQIYPEYQRLEQKLSAFHGIEAEQLLLTNGSDQGIDVVLRALLSAGDTLVLPKPTFAMFAQIAQTQEVLLRTPEYGRDMSYPLAAIQHALAPPDAPAAHALVIVNPNNPTGTKVPSETIRQLLEAFPETAILVDEAYAEFTGETVIPLIDEYPNLAVLRTFSKAYAMPSLRLGFVAANAEFVAELQKVRGPYDVNMMAVAAAEAHLEAPQAWSAYVQEIMDHAKPQVERFLRERQVEFFPGAANFMLLRPRNLAAAVAHLKLRGILVRPQKHPVSDMFRLSVGPLDVMQKFFDAYDEFLHDGQH